MFWCVVFRCCRMLFRLFGNIMNFWKFFMLIVVIFVGKLWLKNWVMLLVELYDSILKLVFRNLLLLIDEVEFIGSWLSVLFVLILVWFLVDVIKCRNLCVVFLFWVFVGMWKVLVGVFFVSLIFGLIVGNW